MLVSWVQPGQSTTSTPTSASLREHPPKESQPDSNYKAQQEARETKASVLDPMLWVDSLLLLFFSFWTVIHVLLPFPFSSTSSSFLLSYYPFPLLRWNTNTCNIKKERFNLAHSFRGFGTWSASFNPGTTWQKGKAEKVSHSMAARKQIMRRSWRHECSLLMKSTWTYLSAGLIS